MTSGSDDKEVTIFVAPDPTQTYHIGSQSCYGLAGADAFTRVYINPSGMIGPSSGIAQASDSAYWEIHEADGASIGVRNKGSVIIALDGEITIGKEASATITLNVGHDGTNALCSTFYIADHDHSGDPGDGGTLTGISDDKVAVYEGGVQVGSVGRMLDFASADFDVTEDAGNDQFDVALSSAVLKSPLTSDLSFHSGADLIVYSDAGSTEVARIDGATGKITSGDIQPEKDGKIIFVEPTATTDAFISFRDEANIEHVIEKFTTGIALRTVTNPASGSSIFEVQSSAGSSRLYVEHDGALGTSNSTIEWSDGAASITESSGVLVTSGDLKIGGNDIKDSGGITRVSLGTTNAFTGGISVSTGDISSSVQINIKDSGDNDDYLYFDTYGDRSHIGIQGDTVIGVVSSDSGYVGINFMQTIGSWQECLEIRYDKSNDYAEYYCFDAGSHDNHYFHDNIYFDGTHAAFDEEDDIQLLKTIKSKVAKVKDHKDGKVKDRLIIDRSTLHPDIVHETFDEDGEHHGWATRVGAMQGFLIGVAKQTVARIEELELALEQALDRIAVLEGAS